MDNREVPFTNISNCVFTTAPTPDTLGTMHKMLEVMAQQLILMQELSKALKSGDVNTPMIHVGHKYD